MHEILFGFAILVLLTITASLARVLWGPSRADRMMGAQLLGTGGVAILILGAAGSGDWSIVDVALVLALLAAFAAVAFVKSATAEGVCDPESEEA